jgi:hypothetical protein
VDNKSRPISHADTTWSKGETTACQVKKSLIHHENTKRKKREKNIYNEAPRSPINRDLRQAKGYQSGIRRSFPSCSERQGIYTKANKAGPNQEVVWQVSFTVKEI